jgi:hypothetical protein
MLPPKVLLGHGIHVEIGVGTVVFGRSVLLADEAELLFADIVEIVVTEVLVVFELVRVEETGNGFKFGQICSIADITMPSMPAIRHLLSVH